MSHSQMLPEWAPCRAVLLAWPYPGGDWDANYDRYGVTIYELRDDDKGNWEDETDERIVGQLYFKHIKSHLGDRVFRITDVIDYEHHVYNNMDAKNPIKLK